MAYVSFDLAGGPGGTVERAILRLYCNAKSAESTHTLYALNNTTWLESGTGSITWANSTGLNHDATGYTVTGVGVSAFSAGTQTISTALQWYSWDVTTFVNQHLAAGDKLTFLIAATGSIHRR